MSAHSRVRSSSEKMQSLWTSWRRLLRYFFSNDDHATTFQILVRRLERSAGSVSSPWNSEAQYTSDNQLRSIELSSILHQGKKRRVRFDEPISSGDAEIKESIDSDTMMNIATASDDSDDTTWCNGSEQDGPKSSKALTNMLKSKFLEMIGLILRRTCGLELSVSFGARVIVNGSTRFSSTNDGRYSFNFPDHEIGGAEIFGAEDKLRGTSTTEKHKDKLQIQVAGEMLATVSHRDVLLTRHEYSEAILEACPNLQAYTQTSRTVYYLVFTHLSLRIAKATFDLKYLNQVKQGYLPEHLKADIMWSHRLRLNHGEDLRKAAKLVMCLMLNFRDEFLSGKHYWLPFRKERENGTSWVID